MTVLVAVVARVLPAPPAGAEVAAPAGERQELVAWAHSRFDVAGLDLPTELDISFDTTLDACDGPGGRYHGDTTPPRIVICSAAVTAQTRRVVLHELAHAWEDAHLSDADRTAFQQRKGLPTWFGRDQPWHHRAGEHLADIIAWGVNDGPGRGIVGVAFDSCAQLAADFQAVTGSAPPAGLPDHCNPQSTRPAPAPTQAHVRNGPTRH
jgi:hypothetical protein